jgi:hypothetical protein
MMLSHGLSYSHHRITSLAHRLVIARCLHSHTPPRTRFVFSPTFPHTDCNFFATKFCKAQEGRCTTSSTAVSAAGACALIMPANCGRFSHVFRSVNHCLSLAVKHSLHSSFHSLAPYLLLFLSTDEAPPRPQEGRQCGCDGVTYDNECALAAAQQSVKNKGDCGG